MDSADVDDALLRLGSLSGGAAAAAEVARAAFLPAQDPAPYLARAELALDAGRCQAARADTAELTWWRPDLANHWRLAGAAARCTGDSRAAVLAYRRYRGLGGGEAEVLRVLEALEASLAAVTVAVTLEADSREPHLALDLPGETLRATPGEGGWRFADLPVGQPLTLRVAGRGLQEEVQEIAALGPGEQRQLAVAPRWIGLGTVRLAEDAVPGLDVQLQTGAGEAVAAAGASYEVTAGRVTATVSSEHGRLEVSLEVADGALVDFDPSSHRPASLTVVDLPAGSAVRLFVEGVVDADAEVRAGTPVQVGTLDPATGVRLAPPRRFDSLPGGAGTLFVEHATLGSARAPVALVAGESNALAMPWKAMGGLPAVRARYQDWNNRRALAEAGGQRARAMAVVAAVLGGVGGALLGGSAGARQDALALNASLDARSDAGGCVDGSCADDQAAVQERLELHRALVGIGAAGAGAAGISVGITVGLDGQTRRAIAEVGEWEPFGATGP